VSWAIWITGPPGSGKSTVTRLTAERLARIGVPVTVLELDRLRAVLTPRATYTDAEREVVYRALVFMAATLTGAGRPVLIDATGHRREWRDLARAEIDRFAEVELAGQSGATVPGVDVAYERARAAELVIDTAAVPAETAAARITALAVTLERSAPARLPAGRGAVIWLTGLPGSGKTTLASRLAPGLAAVNVPVTILEWTALRASVLIDGCAAAAAVEIAHRALACTAAELATAGFAVLVDAAAPRRTWRELGRWLVDGFAEVQLVCAPEICAERERAVRWRPHPSPAGGVGEALEWPLEYEYASRPDLIIDTAAHNEWTASEDLLVFARRLLAGRGPRKERAMRVRDLMSDKPITVSPETAMLEARQRMLEERIRHLIVTEGERVVGIVTDRDIRLNLPSPATSLSVWEINYLLARLTVGDVMTRSVLVVGPDRPAAEAARIMMTHKISALPVTDGARLVGIVTESDFVRVVAQGH
jgi:adenylylsulfate kinase-like enzyme/CBS domain-containing protein